MATTKPRYTITVDDETFQKIENFRFENRFQSRSEATLELIKLGMDVFGVLSKKTGLSENELFRLYLESPDNLMRMMAEPSN